MTHLRLAELSRDPTLLPVDLLVDYIYDSR